MSSKKFQALNRQKIIVLTIIVAFLAVIAALCLLLGKPILNLVSDPAAFRSWVAERGFIGKLAFMGMVVVQVIVAFIPGEPLEIAAGYAFGAIEGTLLCLLGGALGSLAVICLVRKFGMRLVNMFFSQEKVRSLRFLQVSKKRTILFMLILMIPGTPKDLLCYFAGLTDISFPVLMLLCSLGRIPSVVTSTIGGDALGTRSYIFAVCVFAATFAISISGLAIYNAISQKHAARIAANKE
jgi:uncharacterized membrane protein YdjX (TVP38/TMEM64 family)